MSKKVTKDDTYAKLKLIGDIRKINLKYDVKSNEEVVVEIRLGFKGGTLFAYAKEESMMNEMLELKVGDVIKIQGSFINLWYPTASGNFAAIDNIEKWQKIGVLN